MIASENTPWRDGEPNNSSHHCAGIISDLLYVEDSACDDVKRCLCQL